MDQLALSPASCFSSLPWFPGGSPLPHLAREILVLPGSIGPSQVSCWACRRHHPGPCLNPYALLTPRMAVQSTAAYMVCLSCLLGCSAFCTFFSQWAGLKKGKNVGSLCWMPSSWLWNNTMQWNSVIFLAAFSFTNSDARWHCTLRLCVPWVILVLIPDQLGIDQENCI